MEGVFQGLKWASVFWDGPPAPSSEQQNLKGRLMHVAFK